MLKLIKVFGISVYMVCFKDNTVLPWFCLVTYAVIRKIYLRIEQNEPKWSILSSASIDNFWSFRGNFYFGDVCLSRQKHRSHPSLSSDAYPAQFWSDPLLGHFSKSLFSFFVDDVPKEILENLCCLLVHSGGWHEDSLWSFTVHHFHLLPPLTIWLWIFRSTDLLVFSIVGCLLDVLLCFLYCGQCLCWHESFLQG